MHNLVFATCMLGEHGHQDLLQSGVAWGKWFSTRHWTNTELASTHKVKCLRQTENGMRRQTSIAAQPRTSQTTEEHNFVLKLTQQKLPVINGES